ncbi:MAG: prolyl aminopeptidase [Acidiferrobacteraceae bacterium]
MLFPHLEPYATHRIAVDPPHVLYVEECGNPSGIPVLFVHGGPGAGIEAVHRRFFDPRRYRIVLFDQRGAGRSTPYASVQGNTTPALVSDIETLRSQLGVKRWLLFGGSWGSTLALVYAETYPERVLGLILRGIFLCRPAEIRWFYQHGAHWLFPDYWEDFVAPIPERERDNLVAAYYRRVTGDDMSEQARCARSWSLWEARTSTLAPNANLVDRLAGPAVALAMARIETHYFMHDSFLGENEIIRNASRLATIPGIVIHGRYDVVCPLENAWMLHRAWPSSRLEIMGESGHSALEPRITDALVAAANEFADRLSGAP